MLKEKVCSIVIRLFSSGVKHGSSSSTTSTTTTASTTGSSMVSGHLVQDHSSPGGHLGYLDRNFAITVRLLRIVSVLILNYYEILVCLGTHSLPLPAFSSFWATLWRVFTFLGSFIGVFHSFVGSITSMGSYIGVSILSWVLNGGFKFFCGYFHFVGTFTLWVLSLSGYFLFLDTFHYSFNDTLTIYCQMHFQ